MLIDPNQTNWNRWVKKLKFEKQHQIFFPINITNTHWVAVMVDMTLHNIVFYDSFHQRLSKYPNSILAWCERTFIVDSEEDGWDIIYDASFPRQPNGSDCGVHVIHWIYYQHLHPNAPNMRLFFDSDTMRKTIGCDILRGSIGHYGDIRPEDDILPLFNPVVRPADIENPLDPDILKIDGESMLLDQSSSKLPSSSSSSAQNPKKVSKKTRTLKRPLRATALLMNDNFKIFSCNTPTDLNPSVDTSTSLELIGTDVNSLPEEEQLLIAIQNSIEDSTFEEPSTSF